VSQKITWNPDAARKIINNLNSINSKLNNIGHVDVNSSEWAGIGEEQSVYNSVVNLFGDSDMSFNGALSEIKNYNNAILQNFEEIEKNNQKTENAIQESISKLV
jgi:hypothetical protein